MSLFLGGICAKQFVALFLVHKQLNVQTPAAQAVSALWFFSGNLETGRSTHAPNRLKKAESTTIAEQFRGINRESIVSIVSIRWHLHRPCRSGFIPGSGPDVAPLRTGKAQGKPPFWQLKTTSRNRPFQNLQNPCPARLTPRPNGAPCPNRFLRSARATAAHPRDTRC